MKYVNSETFFPVNLIAGTEVTKPATTIAATHQDHKDKIIQSNNTTRSI